MSGHFLKRSDIFSLSDIVKIILCNLQLSRDKLDRLLLTRNHTLSLIFSGEGSSHFLGVIYNFE